MNGLPPSAVAWRLGVTLVCPDCGGALAVGESSATCCSCQNRWPVTGGVPVICRQPHERYLADELTPQTAAQLLDMAARLGWREALGEILRLLPAGEADYLQRYVETAGRALLTELLRIDTGACVLDHGCGWGSISSHLARAGARVVAMDMVSQRARFALLRCREEGFSDVVSVVTGDYPRLPFADASFDAVIINGVLEWVPYSVPGSPGRVQLGRLREVHRVLRPGGQLLLAIENRYWWKYFLGRPEVHTGLRGAALLPRLVARAVYRHPPFRAYTYSLAGLSRLLRRAGFTPVERYLVVPEYNFPASAVPADDRAAQRLVFDHGKKSGARRLLRLAIALGVYRHLAYCFAAVATRPGAP